MPTAHRHDARPGGWSNRDFHDEVPAPRRALERGVVAAWVTGLAFLVMLLAMQHENMACGDACYDGGLRSYEPGHAWTGYEGAWQWQAQWALGVAAFVLALSALGTAGRYAWRRWTVAGNLLALVACVTWITWWLLEPPIPS
jgi:hypothetical protein